MDALTDKLRGLDLKTKQEQAVRNLYPGKDVLARSTFTKHVLYLNPVKYLRYIV